MIQENGYLVDYENLYYGKITADENIIRYGYRVFTTNNIFCGLLDQQGLDVWYVNESTLKLCNLKRSNKRKKENL